MDRQTLRRTAEAAAARTVGRRRPGGLPGAEAVLVSQYGRLARLAYLIVPAELDRRRRLLAAHAVVRAALPGRWGAGSPDADQVYAVLRGRVVRGALRFTRGQPRLLPRAWGLRLFTPDGGPAELAVDRALTGVPAAGRAAYALRFAESLGPEETARVLAAAGVADPAGALRQADRLQADAPLPEGRLAESPRFDPCTVRVRPGDLLRQRRTARLAAGGALLLALGSLWAVPTGSPAPAGRPASVDAAVRSDAPARPLRAATDLWQRTARLDLSAWPARGDRLGDDALIGRALAAWREGRLQIEPGTDVSGPAGTPQLLFAGLVDGTPVVVLYDGARLARFTDGPLGGLMLARADDSDVVTGAALVLHRDGAGARFLLAPWVESAEIRRLRAPDGPAAALRPVDGVTGPVPSAGSAGCLDGAVLQLRSSRAVAEKHAFLLADVGGLLPAHLTYTPPPQQGEARAPREATGSDALLTWARTACEVPELRPGVKALNAWAFARQDLPQQAGTATWVCLRTDRWTGTGSAATELLLPAGRLDEPARRTAVAEGRGCSRFDQNTVGRAWWRSADGSDYLLAAGSRRVSRISVSGPEGSLEVPVPDGTLAVRRAPGQPVTVVATLDDGTRITPPS